MTIKVNPAVHDQSIVGFGGAMTDTSDWLLYDELSPQARSFTMGALFGAQGIHLNFVRIPIAASDFTATGLPYSYDDQPSGQTDPSLSDFSIAHDEAYIVPALKEMLAVDPQITTMASPWSAPPWMKANDAYNNENLSGTVLPQYYPTLAQYVVRFIQDYQAQGVPIDDITPMNEPNSLAAWRWP